MSKLRVYMVAKELGIDNKSLVALFQSLGATEVRNHMSAVLPEQVDRVRRHLSKQSEDDGKVVEQRVRPRGGAGGVIIRRGKRRGSDEKRAAEDKPAAAEAAAPVRRRAAPPKAEPAAASPVRQAAPAPAPKAAPTPAPAPPAPAAVDAEPPRAAEPAPPPAAEPAPPAPPPAAEPSPPPAVAAESVQAEPPRAAEPAPPPPAEPPPPVVVQEQPPAPKRAPEPKAAPAAPAPRAAAPPPSPAPESSSTTRPSSPPKTGIDVWEGRPGVPMPKAPRGAMTPRRVQYDAKVGGGGRRGPMMGGGRMGRGPRRGIGSFGQRRGGSGAPVTQERSAHKKVVKIEGSVPLQVLAGKMGIKAAELLMKLLSLGMTGVNINTTLDVDTAKIVAGEFGWNVEDVAVSEDEAIAAAQGIDAESDDAERVPRAPVVTVMGHVDHGKTSLLDKIRSAQVAAGEAGGITQHIGAYSVKTKHGRITFLDTPGHEAFTQMRARGAQCTDIVILVVAADDGVMPQTKEAITHAKDAGCPIVVAVNKIDKPEAQADRARRELSECGLQPEEWGGDTLFCEVSAHTGEGIDQLLDAVLLQAEVLDLRANPHRHARGTVIEAKLDRGRGPVATVLVTDGTLRKGDGVLIGNASGRVRAMLDDAGRNVNEAGPSMPVAVIGLNEVPSAGDTVDAVKDAKKAQQIADQRRAKIAQNSLGSKTKVSLEELAMRMSQADQKDLKLIVKGDVQGSVEAVVAALDKLSTDKVKVTVVHSAVGAITEGDVNLAVASGAIIIGFNTRPAGKARMLAQKENVEIRNYSVIYDVTDDIKLAMEGLLAPTLVEEAIGEAEVRKIFKVSKAGVVAGCMVTSGVVRRNAVVRLRRNTDIIWEGKLDSLKRFKDDAKEVREGFDCGISFSGYNDLQEGDVIAAFEVKEVRPTL